MTSYTHIHPPIDVVAGRDWPFGGPLNDRNCNPLELAGASIVWKLDSLDGSANAITLSLGSGITIADLATAEIAVIVPRVQTALLVPGAFRDWLTVTLADGTMFDEWSGIIRVNAGPL